MSGVLKAGVGVCQRLRVRWRTAFFFSFLPVVRDWPSALMLASCVNTGKKRGNGRVSVQSGIAYVAVANATGAVSASL